MRVLVFKSEKDGGYWAYTRQDGGEKHLPAELGPWKSERPVEIFAQGGPGIAGIGLPDEFIEQIDREGYCIKSPGNLLRSGSRFPGRRRSPGLRSVAIEPPAGPVGS